MRPERKGRCEDGAGVMRTQGQSEPHGCCNLGQEENEMLERTSGGGGWGGWLRSSGNQKSAIHLRPTAKAATLWQGLPRPVAASPLPFS